MLAVAPQAASASESRNEEAPAPESVEGLRGSLQRAFEERIEKKALFPRLKDQLKDLPPFFRDTKLLLHLRTYVFNGRATDDSRKAAWAAGGWLAYESGWWKDRLGLGATLYTSQKLYGPSDKGGTGLLRPIQQDYTKLGQAWMKLRHDGHLLTLGRQDLNLPYVNRQDSRMTPRTFQGVTYLDTRGRLRLGGGYLNALKQRNEDDFIPISEAAGVIERDRDLSFAGFRFSPSESLTFGAVDYFVPDVLNIFYTEVDWQRDLTPELGLRLAAQLTDQRSEGDDLLTGSSFDTRVFGGRAALSWRGAVLDVAFSTTDGEENIRNPFGSYPGYLSRMQLDFDRAGEDAWGVGLSYHFSRLGLENLSGFTNFTRGTGARDPEAGGSLPTQQEWDLTLDYRLTEGLLRGFWLRLRGSLVHEDGAPKTSKEFRIILNYEIPVL